jgi:hypothetical protein
MGGILSYRKLRGMESLTFPQMKLLGLLGQKTGKNGIILEN